MTKEDIIHKHIGNPTESLRKNVSAAMDQYYNIAIDDAIEVASKFHKSGSFLKLRLIAELESLKKKP